MLYLFERESIYKAKMMFFPCSYCYIDRSWLPYSADSYDLDLSVVPWQIPVRNMKEHSREICYIDRGINWNSLVSVRIWMVSSPSSVMLNFSFLQWNSLSQHMELKNREMTRVAKRVNLRSQNDGHHVPRNTHRLQVGAIVFVIRHQDIAPRLVIIALD